jgi:hypothetical protein
MVVNTSMKHFNVAWKSSFLHTFVLWWITFVVFLPTGTFLNLSTKAEWACRASGTAGAPDRVLLEHPLLFEMIRMKKWMVRKGKKMDTTMTKGGRR